MLQAMDEEFPYTEMKEQLDNLINQLVCIMLEENTNSSAFGPLAPHGDNYRIQQFPFRVRDVKEIREITDVDPSVNNCKAVIVLS